MEQPPESSTDPSELVRIAESVRAANMGAWSWNLRDETAWYSAEFRGLLGHGTADFPDSITAFFGRVHADDRGRLHAALQAHLQKHQLFDLEFRMLTHAGAWKWIRARGRADFENGEPVRMHCMGSEWPLGASRDRFAMTASDRLTVALEDQSRVAAQLEQVRADLLRRNEQLQRAREQAEAATESKSQFLANMSHEIRTPMHVIQNCVDLLLEDGVDAARRQELRDALRGTSDALLSLINRILDDLKLEAGGMSIEQRPVQTVQAVQAALDRFRPLALERGLSLGLSLGGPVPRTIRTDELRFGQILTNILGNAIKFTQHGGVQVSMQMVEGTPPDRSDADPADAPAGSRRLQVSVSDTGPGIDSEQAGRLFRRFVQGDASTTRRFGGSGLGLHLSRGLARRLGGDIRLHSVPGQGSTFLIEVDAGEPDGAPMVHELPARAAAPDPAPAPVAPPASGPTISVLLVEDTVESRRLLEHHMRRAGMQVTHAENGRQAVELAQAALRQQRPYDVVLMDMQMPEMDGYEATRALRDIGWSGPIAALTAHAMHGDRETCLQAGCNEHLTKPIDRDRLLETVRRLAAARPV